MLEQCITSKGKINSLTLPRFCQIEERHVWHFFDGEKKKVVQMLTQCLNQLYLQPQLLRSQKTRIDLRVGDSGEWIDSIGIIESLWNRNTTPLKVADQYLERLPYEKNPDREYHFEDIRNIAITLCQYVQEFQSHLDVLDFFAAQMVLEDVRDYEWMFLYEVNQIIVASDYFYDRDEGLIADQGESYYDQEDHVIDSNNSTHGNEISSMAEELANVKEAVVGLSKVEAPELKVVDVETTLQSFVKDKRLSGTGESTIEETMAFVRTVHELIGKTNLFEVTRDDVHAVIDELYALPTDRNNKKTAKYFSGLTASEAIEINKVYQRPTIAVGTVAKCISKCSGMYEWASKHTELSKNPFESLATGIEKNASKSDKERKLPFAIIELNEVFSHDVFVLGKLGLSKAQIGRFDHQYWVPLICLFSSMRPNECCQLLIQNVEVIEGVLCFVLNITNNNQSLKNRSAKRVIPVHKQLLALGFEDYLKSLDGDGQLFPELTFTKSSKFYGKVETWFRRHFSEKMDLSDKSQSFYSFRHTFIDFYAKNGGIEPIHRQLVGHLNGDVTNDTYGVKFGVEALKEEIDKVSYGDALNQVKPWA
ncbi:site-specific integrase [Vibrio cyclitrophicus]